MFWRDDFVIYALTSISKNISRFVANASKTEAFEPILVNGMNSGKLEIYHSRNFECLLVNQNVERVQIQMSKDELNIFNFLRKWSGFEITDFISKILYSFK